MTGFYTYPEHTPNWHALTVSLEPSDLLYPKSLTIVDKGQSRPLDSRYTGLLGLTNQGNSERDPPPSVAQLEKDTGVSWLIHYSDPIFDDTPSYRSNFYFSPNSDDEDKMTPVLASDKSPEEAALAFFSKYAALFRMEDPRQELILKKIEHSEPGMTHLNFTQHVNQVPVHNSIVSVHFNAKGQIDSISGNLVPNILGMSTRPAFDPTAAVAKAKADLSTLYPLEALAVPTATPSPELFIYDDKRAPVLTYGLNLAYSDSEGREQVRAEYWINAKSGKIMKMDGITR